MSTHRNADGVETLKKSNQIKRIRITLAVLASLTALALGLITPDPIPNTSSNALVATFCLSLAVALATVLALIPAPRDPRPGRSRDDESSKEEAAQETPVEKYTGYAHPVFTRPLTEPDDRQRGR